MHPRPVYEREYDRQGKKLVGKVALITGGDSGIGRAVAVHFAREGADIAILYYKEDEDAQATRQLVEEKGKKAILIQADIKDEADCHSAVEQVLNSWDISTSLSTMPLYSTRRTASKRSRTSSWRILSEQISSPSSTS
jgi:enoyl-[acyl-carrier-protein] reductase (NADH)